MLKDLQAAKTVLAMIEGLDLLLDGRVGHDGKVHQVKNDLKEGAAFVRAEMAEMEQQEKARRRRVGDD